VASLHFSTDQAWHDTEHGYSPERVDEERSRTQAFFAEFLKHTSGLKDMGKRVRNIPCLEDLGARFRMMYERVGNGWDQMGLRSSDGDYVELRPNSAQRR
jgi:hypothetical protein